jgi:hypothetical protein
MSKEYLEALERMCSTTLEEDLSVRDIYETEYGIVEQALQRLESIDNAEPSEALECLEKLKGMEIISMPFSDEYGTQEVDLNDIRKVGSQLNTDFREYTATIKQALIKAEKEHNSLNLLMQELDCKDFADLRKYARCGYERLNKKYLKWEDLEFKKKQQVMDVLLNGKPYILYFYKLSTQNEVTIFSIDMHIVTLSSNYPEDVQFFNDLHLEVVENE